MTVLGHDAQREGEAVRQKTGVLPNAYHVYDRLTGRQHLEFVLEMKDSNEDVDALLERVRIADAADRKAGGYSKGMRQRLVLAMALGGDPDLLVLDEPSTGLEPNGAREMRDIIREEIGLTGLFVPLAAIAVCYKSLAGERELGSIKLLLSLPTNRLNVFTGKVAGRAAVLVFGLGVGLLVGLGFGSVLLGTLNVVSTLVFVLITLGFAAIYAGIMVGLSATTGSTPRTIAFALLLQSS